MKKIKWLMMLILCATGICMAESESKALICDDCCCSEGNIACYWKCQNIAPVECIYDGLDKVCCWIVSNGSKKTECQRELKKVKTGKVAIFLR